HHFDWVLLRRVPYPGDFMVDHLDADSSFALVFLDDAAALWVRRDGALAPLAARLGYRELRQGPPGPGPWDTPPPATRCGAGESWPSWSARRRVPPTTLRRWGGWEAWRSPSETWTTRKVTCGRRWRWTRARRARTSGWA